MQLVLYAIHPNRKLVASVGTENIIWCVNYVAKLQVATKPMAKIGYRRTLWLSLIGSDQLFSLCQLVLCVFNRPEPPIHFLLPNSNNQTCIGKLSVTLYDNVLHFQLLQDTVSKILSSFFKEDKTKGKLYISLIKMASLFTTLCSRLRNLKLMSHCVAVSGDAVLLMAEMLKVFVQGTECWWVQLFSVCLQNCSFGISHFQRLL